MRSYAKVGIVGAVVAAVASWAWFGPRRAPHPGLWANGGPSSAAPAAPTPEGGKCKGGAKVGPPPPDSTGPCDKCEKKVPVKVEEAEFSLNVMALDFEPTGMGSVFGAGAAGGDEFTTGTVDPFTGSVALTIPILVGRPCAGTDIFAGHGDGSAAGLEGAPWIFDDQPITGGFGCGGGSILHNTRIDLNRDLGNWQSTYDIFVTLDINGDALYYEPGRPGVRYPWNAVTQQFGAAPGSFDQLVRHPDGSWTRTSRHGTHWNFNAAGFLVSAVNRQGYATAIQRDVENRPVTVTDYAGGNTIFAYAPSGYLASVTDPQGRTTEFNVSPEGMLLSVSLPASSFFDRTSSAMVTRSKSFTMEYVTGTGSERDGNLAVLRDDAGDTVFSMGYDGADRVVSQSARGGAWSYSYAPGSTTVVSPDAETKAFSFTPSGAVSQIEVFTRTGLGGPPLRAGEPSSYNWTFERADACGCELPTKVTAPDGSFIVMTYDSLGQMTSRTENPAPGSSEPTRTETWTYAGLAGFGQVLTHTTPLGNAGNPADHQTTWTRDGQGRATSISYPLTTVNGVGVHPVATLTYTAAGLPDTVTLPNGSVTKYTYDPATLRVASLTRDLGGLGLTTQYGYDAAGRVASVTDARNQTTTFQYNALGQLTQVQAPGPQATRTQFTYDNANNVHSVALENLDAAGVPVAGNPWWTTTFTLDPSNRVTERAVEVAPGVNAVTHFEYTAAGYRSAIVSPTGSRTEIQRDERGKVFRVTEGAGVAGASTTTYDYDLNGGLKSIRSPLGFASTYTSRSDGTVVAVANAEGTKDTYTLDLDGRIVAKEVRNAGGTLLQKVARTVDAQGLVTSESQFLLDPQGGVLQTLTTNHTFDAGGRLVAIQDPTGATWTFGRDALGRLTFEQDPVQGRDEYAYDGNGNLVQHTIKSWNQVTSAYEVVVLEHAYDTHDRNTSVLRRDGASTVSTTEGAAYDSRDLMVSATDGAGNTRRYAYNGLHRATSATFDLRAGGTGAGAVTGTVQALFTWDLDGRLGSATDGMGRQTAFVYDAQGRITSQSLSSGGSFSFAYDLDGHRTGIIDPLGTQVADTFNSVGLRVARAVTPAAGVLGTTAESFSYDALGRITSATDDDTVAQIGRNSLGWLVSDVGGPNPLGGNGRTVSFCYNLAGATTSTTFPDGTVELRGRDAGRRLTSLSIQGGSSLGAFEYSGHDLVRATLTGAVTETRTHDALGRETVREYAAGSTSLRKFQVAYNPADMRVMEQRHHENGSGDVFQLDSLYRTVQAKHGIADPVAEMANPGSQSAASTYIPSYDAAGNRTQVSVDTGSGPQVQSYASDALNFYTSAAGATCTRNAAGQLTSDGTRTYAYDYKGRLVEVRTVSGNDLVASYAYDAFGRRTGRTTGAGTETYVWGGDNLAAAYDASGLVSRRHLEDGVDSVAAVYARDAADVDGDSSTTDFVWLAVAYDVTNDCAAVLFGGEVAESYGYLYDGGLTIRDGEGQPLSASALGWHQGYGGGETDGASGLVYNRERSYSPSLGRWTTPEMGGAWTDGGNVGNTYSWIGSKYRSGSDPYGDKYEGRNVAVGGNYDHGDAVKDSQKQYEAKGYSTANGANSFAEAVAAALALVDCDCECIKVMVFNAHGSSWGGVRFGKEGGSPNRLSKDSVKDKENQDALKALKDCMCPDGQIIFDACESGSNGDLLEQVAKATGVPAKGPTGTTSGTVPDAVVNSDKDTGGWRVAKP